MLRLLPLHADACAVQKGQPRAAVVGQEAAYQGRKPITMHSYETFVTQLQRINDCKC